MEDLEMKTQNKEEVSGANLDETSTIKHEKGNRKRLTHDLTLMGLSTALLAVCAWISIPIPPIPVTLQTLAVVVVAGLLGWKRGTVSVLVYLALGAIGVPVFSSFKGGIAALTGPTGGYLIGFILMALVIGGAADLFGRKYIPLIAASLLGLVLCYAFGTIWFIVVYTNMGKDATLMSTLSKCVIPFIVPDSIKLALGIILTERLHKILKGKLL